MRYEERIVDEVQSLNDIVEVVSGYLPLKRAGRTFKALCPFHQEKTPSFIVHPEKQIFHCFGCGAGGDVFSFLMKYENLTFPEALRNLAGRVNFSLPAPAAGPASKEASEAESLYEVYRLAQEYYSENLKQPQKGEAAKEYLKKRGFDGDVARDFSLGWATPEWRGLFEFLVRSGVKDAAIFRSGLVQRGREGHPYDLFRGRLLFPICNLQGKVIAFGGRALGDEMPKYLNSPESSVFRKRRELFGLYLAKRFLSSADSRILIVEGYFDFLRVFRSGFQNVVATLGTSLTEDHVRVLKRFVEEAIVIFDGDKAGEAASLRGLEVFLEGEMSVKIAMLPSGKDPDAFIEEKGAGEFKKLVDGALDFFDFKWRLATRRHSPSDSAGLLKISSDFLETFSKIKNPILLDRYLKRLGALLGVGENALRSKLAGMQRKIHSGMETERVSSSSFSLSALSNFPEEAMLIALLLEEPAFLAKEETLSAEDFRSPMAREIFQILTESLTSGSAVLHSRVFNRLHDESIKSIAAAFSMKDLAPPEREKAFRDCLRKVRRRRMEEKLEGLRRAINRAEGEREEGRVAELLDEYRTLLSQKS